jgi:hypothetical protein
MRIRKEVKRVSNVVHAESLFARKGSVGQSTIENVCRSVGVIPKSYGVAWRAKNFVHFSTTNGIAAAESIYFTVHYRSRATRRKSKNLAHPMTGPSNNRPIQ